MNSMQESHNELQKSLQEKTSEPHTQLILSELEKKVDDLKSDIQKLNKSLMK
jgi:hypothetical protein